jgi:pyruvate,orthophosphate dikinase
MKVKKKELKAKLDALHEMNPMLGHRGCRLAITYPEIYEMQVEAIASAAAECVKNNIPVNPEIMIPIVCDSKELEMIRARSEKIIERVLSENGVKFEIKIGSMIEVPRAALMAGKLANFADFFSFGTNDLTQMTFGFSRDDAGKFLEEYYARKVFESDPFAHLDQNGVGKLVEMAVKSGHETRSDIHCGICGEHGGDPESIEFCHRAGLDYVSCSPFRVPIARLAAAHANIKFPRK